MSDGWHGGVGRRRNELYLPEDDGYESSGDYDSEEGDSEDEERGRRSRRSKRHQSRRSRHHGGDRSAWEEGWGSGWVEGVSAATPARGGWRVRKKLAKARQFCCGVFQVRMDAPGAATKLYVLAFVAAVTVAGIVLLACHLAGLIFV